MWYLDEKKSPYMYMSQNKITNRYLTQLLIFFFFFFFSFETKKQVAFVCHQYEAKLHVFVDCYTPILKFYLRMIEVDMFTYQGPA